MLTTRDGDKRRMDAYPTAVEAIEAATKLAQRLDARDYVAASMTREQAIEFANAEARLKPFGVSVDAATAVGGSFETGGRVCTTLPACLPVLLHGAAQANRGQAGCRRG